MSAEYPGADASGAGLSTAASATADYVAATVEASSKIREGMIAVRTVDGIVQHKYPNDPGKPAAGSQPNTSKEPRRKRSHESTQIHSTR